jgi:alkaline phosphatase
VLLGGGGASHGISPERALAAGYTVVSTRAELQAVTPVPGTRLSGQFGDGYLPYELDGLGDLPSLGEMTKAAVGILSLDPEGFFLMVEGGRIDHASHANDTARMVGEVVAFDAAVAWVRSWSDTHGETLVLVTADHETGGLTDVAGNGQGLLPEARWTSTGHTAADVGIWSIGPGSDLLAALEIIDNTDVYRLMRGMLPASSPGTLRSWHGVDTFVAAGRH